MKMTADQHVVFLGDSITEHLVAVSDALETQTAELPPVGTSVVVERHEHRGWTTLLQARLSLDDPERRIRYTNAGCGGDTSRLMLARLDTEVLAQHPHVLLLSAGVVDVRRSFQRPSLCAARARPSQRTVMSQRTQSSRTRHGLVAN